MFHHLTREINENPGNKKIAIHLEAKRIRTYTMFGYSYLQRIMETQYSKQTYRRTKNRRSIQSDRFRTVRRIYGFKTVLTYDQREIRGQLGR